MKRIKQVYLLLGLMASNTLMASASFELRLQSQHQKQQTKVKLGAHRCPKFVELSSKTNRTLRFGRNISEREPKPSIISVPSSLKKISRSHATFQRDHHGHWSLCDHGSRNGTKVNGQLLTANIPKKLNSGDRITFGDCVTYKFQAKKPITSPVYFKKRPPRLSDKRTHKSFNASALPILAEPVKPSRPITLRDLVNPTQ